MDLQAFFLESVKQLAHSSPGLTKLAVACILVLLYILYTQYATPLRKIPGPFIASITKLWILQKTRTYKRHWADIELRKKYGPVVRVGPSEVLITGTQALKSIYGTTTNFPKGEWYRVAGGDRENLDFFPERNMEKLRIQRRAIGPAYTSEAMKDIEPHLDFILEKNLAIMKNRSGESVDIDIFCAMFVLDCIAMMTFSKEKGLIELGVDDGSIRGTQDIWYYMHIMGHFLWLHRLNKTILNFFKVERGVFFRSLAARLRSNKTKPKPKHPFNFAKEALADRFSRRAEVADPHEKDILSKLLSLQSEKAVLKDPWISNMAFTNFGAGIDTTAATISFLLNAIVRHPSTENRVHEELDAARKEGRLSSPPKLGELKNLPFLHACLRESMRLFPVVGTPLWRTVPAGGFEFEGFYIPAGTQIGMNPWVINRETSLYGEDADEWRPERWLECTAEELRRLEASNFNFGTGLRSCPGKHLAEAIFTKIIPMFLVEFDWSLANPEKEPFIQCTFETRLIDEMMTYKNRGRSV